MTKRRDQEAYQIYPYPAMRRFSLDAGRVGHKKHIIHGLVELDVTKARRWIQAHKSRTGERLSFTAFIIHALGRAIEENKAVHAYLDWRKRLVVYEDVDISTMFEVEMGGRKVPMPHIFRAVNRRSLPDIHKELRAIQSQPRQSDEAKFMRWFMVLPSPLRSLFYALVTNFPRRFRDQYSSVLVTAVGMFGRGSGWGIPHPSFTLTVTLGGVVEKPWVVAGAIEIREILNMTLSFNHDVIDGAPAARFTQRLRDLVEDAYGLSEEDLGKAFPAR
jgi:pyruvate/2-oxoglutarate dehydrogenase complex dihydrolipoamide acyltransferase (E2) component